MNIKDVQDALYAIEAQSTDDESAHSMEDALMQDVLTAIADGTCEDPSACARECLKSRDIKFSRWYA